MKHQNKTIITVCFFIFLFAMNADAEKEMVSIVGGEFIMGSDDIETLGSFGKELGVALSLFLENEKPVRKIKLKSFYMEKFIVS